MESYMRYLSSDWTRTFWSSLKNENNRKKLFAKHGWLNCIIIFILPWTFSIKNHKKIPRQQIDSWINANQKWRLADKSKSSCFCASNLEVVERHPLFWICLSSIRFTTHRQIWLNSRVLKPLTSISSCLKWKPWEGKIMNWSKNTEWSHH